jgi:hypothetical protein
LNEAPLWGMKESFEKILHPWIGIAELSWLKDQLLRSGLVDPIDFVG